MCRGENCFWHQIPSLVESEPILALHGTHCCAASGSVAARKCSFYSRRTLRVVGQNCYHLAPYRLSLALDKEQFVRPLAAVLLFCASCFSQAGSSRKPPSLSDADEVRIGKVLAAKFVETRSNGTHPSNNENRRISADGRRQISSSRATQTSIPFSLTLTRDSRVRSRYAGEEFLSGPACSPSWTPRSNLRSSWDMRWNTWRRISAVTV
jgi:hypothetical protein